MAVTALDPAQVPPLVPRERGFSFLTRTPKPKAPPPPPGPKPCFVCGEPTLERRNRRPVCAEHKRAWDRANNTGHNPAPILRDAAKPGTRGYRARVMARLEARGLL